MNGLRNKSNGHFTFSVENCNHRNARAIAMCKIEKIGNFVQNGTRKPSIGNLGNFVEAYSNPNPPFACFTPSKTLSIVADHHEAVAAKNENDFNTQIRTVPSALAVAIFFPLGEKVAKQTASVCPSNLFNCLPDSASQIRAI